MMPAGTCVIALLIAISVTACGRQAPACPDTRSTPIAPSAGCFHEDETGLLVVEQFNGKISIPGGSSDSGESARCAAHRETWEETGLNLQVGELVTVFDTGFHLFHCYRHPGSGDIDPPLRLEVRSAFFLPLEQFGQQEWRYPQETSILQRLLQERSQGGNRVSPDSQP